MVAFENPSTLAVGVDCEIGIIGMMCLLNYIRLVSLRNAITCLSTIPLAWSIRSGEAFTKMSRRLRLLFPLHRPAVQEIPLNVAETQKDR